MSAVLPQHAVDRVLLFMHTKRTGRIELDFKGGRLLSFKVVEYVRLGSDDDPGEAPPLDRDPLSDQDSEP